MATIGRHLGEFLSLLLGHLFPRLAVMAYSPCPFVFYFY